MVKLEKREIAAYLLLVETYGENSIVNIGNALDTLSIIMSRRIARKILKRLWKKGFLEKESLITYKIKPVKESFKKYLIPYIAQRIKKNLKSRNIEAKVYIINECIDIELASNSTNLQQLAKLRIPRFIRFTYSS